MGRSSHAGYTRDLIATGARGADLEVTNGTTSRLTVVIGARRRRALVRGESARFHRLSQEREPYRFSGRLADAPDRAVGACQENSMEWVKPSFVEMRFGFEVAMYILHR